MAKEYIQINDDQSVGLIAISTHVLEAIAKYALEDEPGIHLADSAFRNSIICKIVDNELSVHLQARLDYGKNVAQTCESAQKRIRQTIYQMTDIPCHDVSIDVVGFIF